MPYLIDGHNLIAALPDIDLADSHDEAALATRLKSFAAGAGKSCTVIFDGGLPGGSSALSSSRVRVVFAASSHSSADALIMRRIGKLKDAPNWTVVSSDREIRSCAGRHGARSMSAAEFARVMRSPVPVSPEQGEDIHPRVSEEEVAEWLRVFGGGA